MDISSCHTVQGGIIIAYRIKGGLGRRQLMDYGLEWTRMDSDETVRDEWKSDEKAKGDGDETNEKQMKKQ